MALGALWARGGVLRGGNPWVVGEKKRKLPHEDRTVERVLRLNKNYPNSYQR